MCTCADTSAAAAQAARGSPNVTACRSLECDLVTRQNASRSPGTIDAASSISARTGVTPRVPIVSALVISAPSQCERSMSSRPDTPGKRYLLPPENPATSCGNTGPTISVTSCSVTARLILTRTGCRSKPPESSAIRPAPIGPTSLNAAVVPPGVVQRGHSRIPLASLPWRVAEVGRERLVAHRRVGAQRDEHGQPADAPVQRPVNRRDQQRQRAAAGPVGYQDADAPPVQLRRVEMLAHEPLNIAGLERLAGAANLSGTHLAPPSCCWRARPANSTLGARATAVASDLPRPAGRAGADAPPGPRELLPRPPVLVHRSRAGRRRLGLRSLYRPRQPGRSPRR